MSDIDSRVYGYEPAASQLTELRAEIERLSGAVEWRDGQLSKQAAEITRRRADLDTLQMKLDAQREACNTVLDEKNAEIERLRSALETICTVIGDDAAASMAKIALQALRPPETLGEKHE